MRFDDLKIPILLSMVVLIVPITGCEEEDDDHSWLDPGDVLFELSIEEIRSRDVNGTIYYDAYITIEEVLLTDVIFNWSEMDCILSDDGSGYLANSTPEDMTYFPGNNTDIQFFYDEYSGHIIWVDPLDQVIVTHLTEENQGDSIGLVYYSHGGAWIDLPDDFSRIVKR